MMIRLIPALAILAVPVTALSQDKPAAPATEKKKLVLSRPESKGAKYDISTKVSFARTADIKVGEDALPGQGESVEASVEGVMEVTGVSPKAGNVTGYTFTVRKMSLKKEAGGDDDGLEAGTVVTAKISDGKPVYVVNGGEVVGDLKSGLELIMPDLSLRDESEDGAIAPPGPVAPGDKWNQDKAKLAEIIAANEGSELDTEKFEGTVTYKGPVTVAGMEGDSLLVSRVANYRKLKELPEKAKLIACELNLNSTITLPRDEKTAMPLSTKTVSENRVRFSAENEGKAYEVDLKTSISMNSTAKPVK